MNMSKRASKLKHFKALYRKFQKYDDHSVHFLKCTRAEHSRQTVSEQVVKFAKRKYNNQGRFNVFERRCCLNRPPKFRWHNWQREIHRGNRLAKVKANGN